MNNNPEQAFQRLETGLTTLIDEFLNTATEEEENSQIGYVSPAAALLMSRAAMSVLRGSYDLQQYLRQEELLKDSKR